MSENIYTIDLNGIVFDDHKRDAMKTALSKAVQAELPTVENINFQLDGNIIRMDLGDYSQDGTSVKVNSILLQTIGRELASIKVALIPINKWPGEPFPMGIKVMEVTDEGMRSIGRGG